MDLKQYLIDTFRYNDYANKLVLKSIWEMPKKAESLTIMCHIINSQNKWIDRIEQYPHPPKKDWTLLVYDIHEMEGELDKSLAVWEKFLETKTEANLYEEVNFIGFDGGHWTAILKDIALQLNYHAVHHAAQIQLLIRQQGLTPNFVDYIGTKYRRISD